MVELKGYHAHVYFDASTRASAEQFRDTIVGRFAVQAGVFADEARGPHPIPQFNIIFEEPEFAKIVPWLILNHDPFSVLIHPLSPSNYDDHSKYAMWLGTPVPMRLERLSKQLPQELLPESQRAKA